MKRVLTAVALVPVVLLVVFAAPLWLFALVVAAVAMLALHEYLGIAKGYGIQPLSLLTYLITLLFLFGAFALEEKPLLAEQPWLALLSNTWLGLTGFTLLFGIPIVFRRDMKMALAASGTSAFALLYLGAPLAVPIFLRAEPFHGVFVVFALLSVWAGDTAAFYIGRSLGKHKLAPIVSPKKSWEGAVASVLASVAVAMLVFHFQEPLSRMIATQELRPGSPFGHWRLSLVHQIALGILTNVAAQLGDLFESAIKRGAQVKDSGSILPGHGGILDRIDALLFAFPAVWYYAVFHAYFFRSQ